MIRFTFRRAVAFVTPATPLPLTGLMALFGTSGAAVYVLFRPRPPR